MPVLGVAAAAAAAATAAAAARQGRESGLAGAVRVAVLRTAGSGPPNFAALDTHQRRHFVRAHHSLSTTFNTPHFEFIRGPPLKGDPP